MQYTPTPPARVESLDDMLLYVVRELRQVERSLQGAIRIQKVYVEPEKKVDGLVAYADGTEWNPGSGKGMYYWDGAAWNFLG